MLRNRSSYIITYFKGYYAHKKEMEVIISYFFIILWQEITGEYDILDTTKFVPFEDEIIGGNVSDGKKMVA